MGEFLRKWVSRRLLILNEGDMARVMTAMRQFGNGVPCGTETIAIFHQLLHDMWQAGELPTALARIKVDEKNCFGMLRWKSIRKAAKEALPRHYAVASWKHRGASFVEQEGVEPAVKDRGAEQGDVDAPLESSLTLGEVASNTRNELHAAQRRGALPWAVSGDEQVRLCQADYDDRQSRATAFRNIPPAHRREEHGEKLIMTDPRHEVQAGGGVADFWYLDDGDILCDARLVLPYLTNFDIANPEAGAERNIVKTKVFYFTDAATLEANAVAWQIAEVRALATVETAAASEPTLGVVTGPLEAVSAQMLQKIDVVKAMHTRTAICQDVQTEHVLNRQSLGVGRVNHILRVHGANLLDRSDVLSQFDNLTHDVMDRLFPGLTPESHEQGSLSAAVGGLGWRKASDIARSANLAALLQAGPRVRGMAAATVHAGLLRGGLLESRLDLCTQRVEAAYLRDLDEVERVKAEAFISKVKDAAEEQWRQIVNGQGSAGLRAPHADASYASDDDHHVNPLGSTQDGGSSDVEGTGRRLTVAHVQKELARLRDCTRLRALEVVLRRQGNWPQLERLKELRHPEVSHKWLWHLDASDGAVLTQADYVANVQKRLGARILGGVMQCRLCGAPLDLQLEHAEVCATAEATRGHYACVRAIVQGLRLADPAVTTEPRGLSSTQARPADILTVAAVPGRSAALDVCIASPNAAAAQGDAAEAEFRRKLHHYRNVIPELTAAGIAFRPLIWTADGRPHPAVVRTLRYAADQATVRGGTQASSSALLGRWKHEIMVAILRRRAAMTRAALPRQSERARWLLTGRSDHGVDIGSRHPPLDEDGEVGSPVGDDIEVDDDDGTGSLNEGAGP